LIAILADALHSNVKNQNQSLLRKLDVEIVTLNGQLASALTNFPLAPMTGRIIRGMHSLLYREYLPPSINNKFHAPLPEAEANTKLLKLPLEQTFAFSETLRKAVLTDSAEIVRAYNGKFKYACTWEHLDDGTPFCIFAFDIYRFYALAPPLNDFPRAFIGMYIPEQAPDLCSWAPRIEMEFSREEILHPLAQT